MTDLGRAAEAAQHALAEVRAEAATHARAVGADTIDDAALLEDFLSAVAAAKSRGKA